MILISTAMLAACGRTPEQPRADHAWIRLSAIAGRPAAEYFDLDGGRRDDALVAARTPAAARAELHESMKTRDGAMMTMKKLDRVPLPAGGHVAFAPGGRHVMLFDVNPKLQPGDTVPFTLTLASGATVSAQANVVAAGQSAPE
ncbi:copper chaperone PCu(A)C [Stakelama sp. CBK3Z-3]|uniref:Copper chaperone PCu(A)C n=1 Tax=Stakelama flava TaxID=2860338 RepID=A0ABS6XPZ7_9SPHN|nr:copper chaperone PCu(A)C [Stakelama flava]MBW4331858.1 copper chaperone PCu(A)C [Stakelama flava]